jgi:hypothetical protein
MTASILTTFYDQGFDNTLSISYKQTQWSVISDRSNVYVGMMVATMQLKLVASVECFWQ